MSYGAYRQCHNGNYEQIEDYATVSCQRCGEELNPCSPVFEREQSLLCASCYLESLFRKEVIGDWFLDDEDMARKVADMFGDACMEVEELIGDYATSDLGRYF